MADSSSPYLQTELSAFGVPGGPPSPSQLLHDTEASEDERRALESAQIASRFAVEMTRRGPNHTFSPDYVASQPLSLAAKLRVTPEEEEEILFHYASTSSLPQTATLAGVGEAKVRAVVFAPSSQDALSALRSAMRMSIIRKIEETQVILLDALQTPSKLNDASLTQISAVLTQISETQLNLLNASRTASLREIPVDPAAIFSGDELEYMAFLRRRLATASPSALQGGPADFAEGFEGHEFVDPSFAISPTAPSAEDEAEGLTPREIEIAEIFLQAAEGS